MVRPPASELTQRELELMHIFWQSGEVSIAEVQSQLANKGRSLAQTTVATLVRILHKKGFLELTREERPFLFRACRSQPDVSRRLIDDLIERVFGGSRERLLVQMFSKRKLTAAERAVLAEILKEQQR